MKELKIVVVGLTIFVNLLNIIKNSIEFLSLIGVVA